MKERPQLIEVRISVPTKESAKNIAEELVGRRLAGCVQVLGPMTSVYSWRQQVHESQEWLLLAKTTERHFEDLLEATRSMHGYEVPEVLAVPVNYALGEYVDWITDHLQGRDDAGREVGPAG
ncbi:Periplasmic divalent cation tolerance protein CutA [Serinicoccus hydrothermalis]|uniref:Periplasmic divalent cation tolerance protein CutA n=1 Tax=Serinicoccus hydrothermalis TaxID=1758689 RepID=A0A1B1NEP1_9MICO|nr:divalent-cation tolerance protein CutA [Serinicoccus hydrothermalis]ANS79881.1 Periplasmic divalent cation tolerance protein CutA [Serinicoccus hydrothermalis]